MPLYKVVVRGGLTLGLEKKVLQGESVDLDKALAELLPPGTVELAEKKPEKKPDNEKK